MIHERKTQLLQYLLKKQKDDAGFTLIELLVVIIIIGILSAIALPSFVSQANKAKQSEAKTYVASMNRAQQVYYLENGKFTDKIDQLGIGINNNSTTEETYKTDNYQYKIEKKSDMVVNDAISQTNSLKSYAGVVILKQEGSEATTQAILCESDKSGTQRTAQELNAEDAQRECPKDFSKLNQSSQPNNSPTSNTP
ncbi:type IV pilin-like G/H family protein [Brasilonema sp. UFV-L1]|uniref:type IV pilin-like G/H family protein n=1 Tax=Brasilonema sp. UFV-L1 TaxID=2234130 RepID=UPI00145D689B|nr:type IV pilin-like G/H family protein [Brasilonema sp. UFV-L1]NMG08583.1 pesticin [Brasilonema sp. UFV-L1]